MATRPVSSSEAAAREDIELGQRPETRGTLNPELLDAVLRLMGHIPPARLTAHMIRLADRYDELRHGHQEVAEMVITLRVHRRRHAGIQFNADYRD